MKIEHKEAGEPATQSFQRRSCGAKANLLGPDFPPDLRGI